MDVSITILVHLVMKRMIQFIVRINLFLRVQCRHMAVVAINELRFSQCYDVTYVCITCICSLYKGLFKYGNRKLTLISHAELLKVLYVCMHTINM